MQFGINVTVGVAWIRGKIALETPAFGCSGDPNLLYHAEEIIDIYVYTL